MLCRLALVGLAALLVASSAQAFGTAADKWNGKDKIKHVQYSCVLGLGTGYVVSESKWEAFGWAMVPGGLKELNDSRIKDGSGFSHKDMVANAIGAGICVQGGHWAANYDRGTVSVSANWRF
jgi:uncharacterized protein YfiM (DUF2279 family)